MTTKHSEGKWIINLDQEDCGDDKISVETDDGYFIAQVDPGLSQDANARLITAAPDLLAALQAAVECHIVPISSAREGGAVAFSIQTRVADQIRDAIAKATGAA